jgi:hypothetical protein
MGVFCIEVTANDESISYIFEKVNIPLSFIVMLQRQQIYAPLIVALAT